MKTLKKTVIFIAVIAIAVSLPVSALSDMTPYNSLREDGYFNGATYILPTDSKDIASDVTTDLERMKDEYGINTISVYDLENLDKSENNENKDHLFSELKRLDMKIVVRIENYQASSFKFDESDLDYIMNYYDSIIRYVSSEEHRSQVTYFALNMPVDDGTVQKNLGGINSEAYLKNQVTYAERFVSRMRAATSKEGFSGAKMYLSVFYGWDNSYETPAYTSADADGYFINNYSYPINPDSPADENTSDEELINSAILKKGVDKFKAQYGDSPLVIEYGFHTAEYNDGEKNSQIAGLVQNRAAKGKALKAVSNFYAQYPFVTGMMYFGYNLFKNEGNPPMEMDWALYYSFYKSLEMENGKISGNAAEIDDKDASGGKALKINGKDASLRFDKISGFAQMGIYYRTEKDCELEFRAGGERKTVMKLPASGEYTSSFINLTVSNGSDIEFVSLTDGELYLDYLVSYSNIEAENGIKNGAEKLKDKNASQGESLTLPKNGEVIFNSIRGGSSLKIAYKAVNGAVLHVNNGGITAKIELPSVKSYTELSVKLNITSGTTLTITNAGNELVQIDYLGVSGIGKAINETAEENGNSTNRALIIISGVLGAVAVVAIGFAAAFTVKLKKR